MQKERIGKYVALLLIPALLIAMLVSTAAAAWTDEADNTLNAVVPEDTQKEYPELEGETFHVHLYKVGDVNADGKVTPLADYADVTGLKDITPESKAEEVDAVITLLTEQFESGEKVKADADFEVTNFKGSAENLANGIYLAVTDTLEAGGFRYAVNSALVMLPWTNTVYNNEYVWESEGTMVLKIEREQGLGDIEIIKNLTSIIKGDKPTFVFSLYGTCGEGEDQKVVLDDVFSMTFPAAGRQKAMVKNLPVGSVVTVTEVYCGKGYRCISAQTYTVTVDGRPTAAVTPLSDDTVVRIVRENEADFAEYEGLQTAEFTNEPSDIPGSYSFENVYEAKFDPKTGEFSGFGFRRRINGTDE